ncbi:HD domain protein [Halomonas sp. THAF5a]|uniref:HD domain-containing protein n=1 Tax=Halomonas sp. THAF5a TaxID=2587844 RepID=UPI001268C886|nr:HD domain-containing protein [Halomonas sp. THAF5a]QFU00502.1 HD domain protein [Halomonas sp. THAF5a]
MTTVSFTQMKDGTKADYELLGELEERFVEALPERILEALKALENTLSGYRVSRLEHVLQSATRAEDDGEDEEMIVAALIHDLGDDLAPHNHSQYAASIIRPYVRAEVTWIIEHHGLFQNYYYIHHFGGDPLERDRYEGHPWYQRCVDFCERWDQASFDPDYPTRSLEHFAPMVRRIFSRPAFAPSVVGDESARHHL